MVFITPSPTTTPSYYQIEYATTSISTSVASTSPTYASASSTSSIETSDSVLPLVPFYSQFRDITSSVWQKVGCGVTSLAMIIDYYKTDVVVVDAVLGKGIEAGAYDQAAGWTYRGLISVSRQYGLDGEAYDLGKMGMNVAFNQFETYLIDGPVIASIHYKFNPKSRVPHLVVITGIKKGMVYYNDPAAKIGGKQISVADFEKGWKKRFIVLRPTKISGPVALTGWHPHTSRL